ncbi:hypothetical protein B7P43_G09761 [Cryptotermes secundus]|uniref:Aminotransferase class I/classII large domain-containing protein n=1 Tax=Cryptotermes secundus TaxID=105785 RepID=A0A2J7RH42_9NEOP|nr:1-aminocyclopropane-1-carboxylate synthase-like protein 1 isoform X2 [Cryptotermes secundus]PNF40153.1 hypothetical protein B7P43_G09761 [Cryptotermes secundus]
MVLELSKRAQQMLNKRDFLDEYTMLCMHDPFNQDTNKKFGSKEQHYFPMWGTTEMCEALASCLTRHLAPDLPVLPENVLVVNGGVAAMEVLACCLLDPGDVLLTPSPCYTRIIVNFSERFKVNVVDVLLRDTNEISVGERSAFELNGDLLEDTIMEQKATGRVVKAFYLVNPNNPLGEVYSPQLVLQLMEVCHRHGLHFISDEAYAMSIYEPQTPFQSVLNLSPLPDPQKTHVIWSFSKDMNLAGIRIGALISQNKDLLHVVKNTSVYTAVPAIVQKAAASLLNDTVWLDEEFLPTHRQRLREAAHKTQNALISLGAKVQPAQAGFFLWANLRCFLPKVNHDEELALFKRFMAHKVYLTPGSEMRCADPGWFRIVFSSAPHVLEEGLSRIADTIKEL